MRLTAHSDFKQSAAAVTVSIIGITKVKLTITNFTRTLFYIGMF